MTDPTNCVSTAFLSLRMCLRYHWVSKNDLTRTSLVTPVMLAVAVTVLDRSDVIWSGRLVRLDESDKLKDVLGKLAGVRRHVCVFLKIAFNSTGKVSNIGTV